MFRSNYFNLFSIVLLCYLPLSSLFDVDSALSNKTSEILSRRKRYVAFPDGSSFSVAGCMTVGIIGDIAPHTNPGTYVWAMNWAIAYELPNVTETTAYYQTKKHKINMHMQQRKHRRDLYGKLETILEDMGYNGRECILKTLCETSQRLIPHGGNMIEEMFRTLFSMPASKVLPIEPFEHTIYDAAHRLGHILDSCDRFKCPISLVDLIKGYYDSSSSNQDTLRSHWPMFS